MVKGSPQSLRVLSLHASVHLRICHGFPFIFLRWLKVNRHWFVALLCSPTSCLSILTSPKSFCIGKSLPCTFPLPPKPKHLICWLTYVTYSLFRPACLLHDSQKLSWSLSCYCHHRENYCSTFCHHVASWNHREPFHTTSCCHQWSRRSASCCNKTFCHPSVRRRSSFPATTQLTSVCWYQCLTDWLFPLWFLCFTDLNPCQSWHWIGMINIQNLISMPSLHSCF